MLVLVRVRVERISSSVFFPTNLVILLFLLFALFLSFPNLIYFFYICSYRRTWATKILVPLFSFVSKFVLFDKEVSIQTHAAHKRSNTEAVQGIKLGSPEAVGAAQLMGKILLSSWPFSPHISAVCLQKGPSRRCSTTDECS